MTEYTPDEILSTLGESTDPVPRYTVQLNPGDRAWNPASTSTALVGPALVTYTQWPDGGIVAQVGDL